jgi:hypothetical protein
VNKQFPRALTDIEREILAWLLPKDRQGYAVLNGRSLNSLVIGEGRWGENDLVLAEIMTPIDRAAGMEPIAARGELRFADRVVSISLHEMNAEGQIEFDLGGELSPDFLDRWCYSYWEPGDRAPATGEAVRIVRIAENRYTLAISREHKTVWLHHHPSRFNQLLPVTGFYESLLRAKPSTDKAVTTTPRALFEQLDTYSDKDLFNALMSYNDEARKFDASGIPRAIVPKKTFWDFIRSKLSS